MNATELAHWRYRVKALTTEIAADTRLIADVNSFTALLFSGDIYWSELGIDFKRYLLEEAKYMCELGELTLT